MDIKTKPRPPARYGDPVPACGDCGTRFGHTQVGRSRPDRISGARFGYTRELCSGCWKKHDKRAKRVANRLAEPRPIVVARPTPPPPATIRRYTEVLAGRPRPATSCDLCGTPAEVRFDADEFGIENQHGGTGRVCKQCRDELRQERAVIRQHKLAKLSVGTHNERKCVASRVFHLTVLNPYFEQAELTTRAVCRIMVAETRRRERRAG